MAKLDSNCSLAERAVLEMIKCWPGVPATVTFHANQGWSVSTSSENVEKYLAAAAPAERDR